MTLTLSEPLTVGLDKDSHRYAEIFAAEQATPQKGKRDLFQGLRMPR